MVNPQFNDLNLTITQAAYWLDLEPGFLAEALDEEDAPQWLCYALDAMTEEYEEDPEIFKIYRLGTDLKHDTWKARTAKAAIPILIEQAQKGEVISYADLDAELRRRDRSRGNAGTMQKYGYALGVIGSVIDEIRDEAVDETSIVPTLNAQMPPLEALVVRGREGVPGSGIDGFLISYLEIMGEAAPEDLLLRPKDRRAAVNRIHADIFAWSDWSVLEKLSKQ